MRILVTGAGGFLGRRLVRALAVSPPATSGAGPDGVNELVLVDRAPVRAPQGARVPVRTLTGDLADTTFVGELARAGFDSLFHLAATLTLDAERDPDHAYAVNVETLRRLVAAPHRRPPRVVFTSSIAVFGGALPRIVDDAVRAAPTTTYGAHKAVLELLLADATRRGTVDARSLRLPIVVTRPGAATPAVSDRVAALLREPLAGRDVVCPLRPDTRLCLASAGAVVRALLALHGAHPERLPPARAMNMPALSVTVAEIAAAATAWPGRRPRGAVSYAPDPALQAVVDGWPQHFASAAASGLGLAADADLAALIADHLDNPEHPDPQVGDHGRR